MDIRDDAWVIRPFKGTPPDQEYFFTQEWQEKGAEADREVAAGELLGPFETSEAALDALKNTGCGKTP
jgi:hypothetical protein